MDITCTRCAEPWDQHHLRWDAPYEPLEADEPTDIAVEHKRFLDAYDDHLDDPDSNPEPVLGRGKFENFFPIFDAVARGRGCPACWNDPSRANISKERRMAVLAENLDNYDGDPLDLIEGVL